MDHYSVTYSLDMKTMDDLEIACYIIGARGLFSACNHHCRQ